MRAGACAVQQGLTSEAAGVVKQAVVLAKRRGHAQVTPLHVANTMLAASNGLLRVACQRSRSHPLQCKALELCFNVALNRLPASSPSPMVSHHHPQYPSISNALVAAFKRAQAHQRRGSVENQANQQPLLTVKIELEQLVISILDDPSVSRVMAEAGFSSTQVKNNVEKAVSSGLCSQSSSPPPSNKSIKEKNKPFLSLKPSSPPNCQNGRQFSRSTASEPTKNDDVGIIIETLLMNRKRRSLVIVGESISNIESTVKELMDGVDRGEVPEGLMEVKFICLPPLYSFYNLQMDLVEQKMGELTCLVKSLAGKGVVLYLGDLNWISEYKLNLEQDKSYYSNSVEHMITELARLVCGIGETGRVWLMGIATFRTYIRCRNGYHSLESVWGLHPVTIPANTLGLSLISHSDEHSGDRNIGRANQCGSSQLLFANEEANLITCCADCSAKFEDEARSLQTRIFITDEPTLSSQRPPWLVEESRRLCKNDQCRDSIRKLRLKWNSYCDSAHKQHSSRERTLIAPCSASPSSSQSCYSFDQLQNPNRQESQFSMPESNFPQKLKEFNTRNLNMLCDALEEKVPWQREIIPEIAGTILDCRSGMLRRKDMARGNSNGVKEETWLLFLGPDHGQAKQKISRELARIIFGSYSNFVPIGINSSITRLDYPPEDHRDKRWRDDESCISLINRFAQAVSANPHRVFLVEDFEKLDYSEQIALKSAIETGRIISNENGEQEVRFSDAIVVLTCGGFNSGEEAAYNVATAGHAPAANPCATLDLNMSVDEDSIENCDFAILENVVDRCVVFQGSGLVES